MSEYWNRRSAQLESLTQKRTDETVKFVNGIYSEALKSIGERVKTVFDRYSSGGSLSEESALKLLNTKQTAEFRQELLNKYNSAESPEEKKRLAAVLDAPAYADRISRLEALANEIYAEALSLGTAEQVQLEKRLIAEYKHTYYKTTFDIQQYTGEFYDFEKLSSGRVKEAIRHKWIGKNYSERVWDNTDKTAEKLRSVVIKGIMTGQSSRTMTDSLAAVLGEDSDSGARFKFSRLIRTEVNYISGQATQRAYEQAEIEEYVFLATLDKRTCHDCGNKNRKSCAELDGKHFKLSEAEVGVNKHPMHPFCRCSDYPYIEGKKGTRAARDESGKTIFVPNGMTYDEWYRKYVDKSEENGIIKSGAISGARNPFGKKAEKHADQYYESVRAMKTDVAHIAKTTGHSEQEIQNIKNFIFYEKHDLGGAKPERFAPDFMMCESWQRLINGTPEPHDLTLIKHEIMEQQLINQGFDQATAHIKTSEKYNYSKEASEFYDNIKKYKD